jgi:glycosyltransferase involved in cell wall biosynthesis
MNVGIMLSEQLQSPEIGGGFTFEGEILDALLRLRSESLHCYYLLGPSAEKPAFLSTIDLTWITTSPPPPPPAPPPSPPPPAPPTFWAKMLRGFGRVPGPTAVEKEPPPAEKQSTVQPRVIFDFDISPAVKNASIELVCYLNPWVSPFLDIPYILNLWDLAHRIYPFFPEISLAGEWETRERFFRRRLQRASYIITPNACGKREVTYLYQVAEERVRTLHHPTPTFALKAGAQSIEKKSLVHLGVKGDFLLYPAQFWPHKNHVLLLHVLKSLHDKYGYEPQLVFTGSDKPLFNYAKQGNQSFVQERAHDLSLPDQVIFAGFVSREDLIALYQQALALVYPSFFGPENLPPLEAFALGCPVIAARIPGSEEQFADAALQVDPTHPEAWVEAIQKIRRDADLRESLIAKGKQRAFGFTSDDFARGLFQIVDEFVAYRRNWPSSL